MASETKCKITSCKIVWYNFSKWFVSAVGVRCFLLLAKVMQIVHKIYIWATTWENVLSDMRAWRRLKSACAFLQSYQSLFVHKKMFCILGDPKCAQWRFWSDCANAQADLNLRWAHMSEGTFSDDTAYFNVIFSLQTIILSWRKQVPFICYLSSIIN